MQGSLLLIETVQLYNCPMYTVTLYCTIFLAIATHKNYLGPLYEESDKIPEGRTSTYILHFFGSKLDSGSDNYFNTLCAYIIKLSDTSELQFWAFYVSVKKCGLIQSGRKMKGFQNTNSGSRLEGLVFKSASNVQ